jgi:hypothetical protein
MKCFVSWLNENNTTALFSYGKDFQSDVVTGEWDVEDFHKRNKMKPWEVKNALYAEKRREDILRWANAGFNGLKEVITDKSVPVVPDWQSMKR